MVPNFSDVTPGLLSRPLAPPPPCTMADKASLHLDERWDKLIDLSVRRLSYGTLAGGAVALLLMRKSRWHCSYLQTAEIRSS